jgi:glutathione synthase/RimK-type ligase-like ATP-grasp enzyme
MNPSPARPVVLLATCAWFPEGEPGHEALDAALAARGLDARWAVWDDEAVEWADADLIAVRATWDYDSRIGEFLGWAAGLGPRLLNGVKVFRWNTDKRYLLDLQDAGLPVIPTMTADTPDDVRRLASRHPVAVVKPRVGAGGRGLDVVTDAGSWEPHPDGRGPWIVQPLVESIHRDGETSVFVLGGQPVSQVDKLPSTTDIRVHEQYGGSSRPVPLDPAAALLAAEAVATVTDLLGGDLAYGRVDLMRHRGRLVVSEIELTEPGLYLDVLPENAEPFADAVAARVRARD